MKKLLEFNYGVIGAIGGLCVMVGFLGFEEFAMLGFGLWLLLILVLGEDMYGR